MPDLLLGPVLRHVTARTATVWVETDAPCEVAVLGHRERTFQVAGHHYALVCVTGLEPATSTEYDVRLDGELVWPDSGAGSTAGSPSRGGPAAGSSPTGGSAPGAPTGPPAPGGAPTSGSAANGSGTDRSAARRFPASRIRTPDPERAVRVSFGSCRYATASAAELTGGYGGDALDALARALPDRPDEEWPDLLVMLGDQVYADETTEHTRRRIAARRSLRVPPGAQVADFEEYTWLYAESWADPEVRWLMSTVPSAMIFDDHDVHDDWNTSRAWRADMRATSWWAERITGGLMSYWVYQHLGNLSPDELVADPTYAAVRAAEDGEAVLREFALAADRESDGGKGARWSHCRDLGTTRLLVLDSRCGRMLDGERAMLSAAEREWVVERLAGSYDHLLIGTSVPWLMPPALHDVEAWDERLCDHPGPRRARLGEKLRQAGDLEHWPAFSASFDWLAGVIADVGRGRLGPGADPGGQPPATVCVLSGDVHHSYVCEAHYPNGDGRPPPRSRVYQLTCSPVHNTVPWFMRLAFQASWSGVAEVGARLLLGRLARVPRASLGWTRLDGPVFGNALGTLTLAGRDAHLLLETTVGTKGRTPVRPAIDRDLT